MNLFLLAEIAHLAWQRQVGGYNTAQGDFAIAMHIMAASVPISGVLLVGLAMFAVMRKKVPPGSEAPRGTGSLMLVLANIAAPVLLFFGLKWSTWA
jgi:hypothetical protein